MAKIIVVSLLLALEAILLPMAQAKNFGDGGYGRLIHGKTVDETGLLTGIADSVNNVVCRLFNPKFLSSMSKNSKCPGGSFPSNAFDSIGSFCECMRSYPNLQECYTSAAFAYELNTPGVVDVVVRLGRCCNMELRSYEFGFGGQAGHGLYAIYFPRNQNALVNKLGFAATAGLSDLMCSFFGRGFLELLSSGRDCSKCDNVSPDDFETEESFCDCYTNKWSTDTRECFTDSAIEILAKFKGVTNTRIDIGTCCTSLSGKKSTSSLSPPSSCNSNPTAIDPEC